MKLSSHFGLLILIGGFYAATSTAQSTAIPSYRSWYKQVSANEGFIAAFPSKPEYRVKDKDFQDLRTVFRRYINENYKNFYFEVGHTEYPTRFADRKHVFDTLASGFATTFSKANGKIHYRRAISVGDCVGEEVYITASRGSVVKIRMFMSGQSLYQLTAATYTKSAASDAVVDHFLNSFSVTGGCSDRIAPVEPPSGEIRRSSIDGIIDPLTGWRKIVSGRDGIEMLLPTSPRIEEEVVMNAPRVVSRTYLSSLGTATYYINVLGDIPGEYGAANSNEIVLDLLEKNLTAQLATINPRITRTRNLKLGKFIGREYALIADGRLGKAQIFVNANKRYLLIASDSDTNYSKEYIDRFFDSIRISTK